MSDNDKYPRNQNARDRELDDFWDISRLLPKKPRRQVSVPRHAAPPAGVEIELPPLSDGQNPVDRVAPGRTGDVSVTREARLSPYSVPPADPVADPVAGETQLGTTHYVPPHTAVNEVQGEPEFSYLADGVLLHRVDVYVWKSSYRYFDQFVQDAATYARRAAPTEQPASVSYFSFFPQYAQMNRRQAAWYLWWREQVRHGAYRETDYAYILLYIFELINQPLPPAEQDRGEAQAVGQSLAHLWMAYRHRYPQLDHYMCEWLCDFCLIHRLSAPTDALAPALDEIVNMSSMKEFYLSAAVGQGGKDPDLTGARILLRYGCQYDYRKSKFAGGEQAVLFDRIIPGAVAEVLPLLMGHDGQPPLITMQDSTVVRDAYTGALCAYSNKRRVAVSYTSFSRSHDLRFLMGDMVRHIENRLRKYIGVRSRLSVVSLPPPIREALDAYLDPLLPTPVTPKKPKHEPPRPAYEALYDLPAKPVSLEDAAKIEQTSWETTRILTDAFGEGDASASSAPVTNVVAPSTGVDTDISRADGRYPFADAPELTDFLRLAYAGDGDGQHALASRLHTLPDALADRINEWAVGSDIGDVILEETDGVYAVVDDYREAVSGLI